MYCILLLSINFFNIICVFVGLASVKDIFMEGRFPSFSKVHTPLGPLEKDANQEIKYGHVSVQKMYLNI